MTKEAGIYFRIQKISLNLQNYKHYQFATKPPKTPDI